MRKLRRGYRALLDEANAVVRALSPQDAARLAAAGDALIVDLREGTERTASGCIAGAVHVPRGQLEFLADPECPLHRPELATDRMLLLHCASGGRSALAAKTLLDMGFPNVAHLAGGIKAWRDAGLPVEPPPAP